MYDYVTTMGSQWPWVQSGFLTLHTLVRSPICPTYLHPIKIRLFDLDHAHENAFLYGD
jgi:hypothetical protein